MALRTLLDLEVIGFLVNLDTMKLRLSPKLLVLSLYSRKGVISNKVWRLEGLEVWRL